MNFIHETDSKIVYTFPKEWGDFDEVDLTLPTQVTVGSGLTNFIPLRLEQDITKHAREIIRLISETSISEEALRVLNTIRNHLVHIQIAKILPPIRAVLAEDGSLLLEWIFNNFRIGFSIEQEIRDSGWYFVSKETYGGINASGLLDRVDIEPLIKWLINYVTIYFSL
jgi:hypothetical protein